MVARAQGLWVFYGRGANAKGSYRLIDLSPGHFKSGLLLRNGESRYPESEKEGDLCTRDFARGFRKSSTISFPRRTTSSRSLGSAPAVAESLDADTTSARSFLMNTARRSLDEVFQGHLFGLV